MSEIKEKISKWKDLYFEKMDAQERGDDHASCSNCRSQVYFCDCVAWQAQEVLEALLLKIATQEEK